MCGEKKEEGKGLGREEGRRTRQIGIRMKENKKKKKAEKRKGGKRFVENGEKTNR